MPGFTGDPVQGCTDINECADLSQICGNNAICLNTIGSADCICPGGYQMNFENDCVDIDECTGINTDFCHSDAICYNFEGGHNCICKIGYSANGLICEELDECATGVDNCSGNADCTNTDGAYTCQCHAGFTGNGFQCITTDPESPCDCGTNEICENDVCECLVGFDLENGQCTDINECDDGECTGNNEVCFNLFNQSK